MNNKEYDYLEIYENVLSNDLCEKIIDLFLKETNKCPGLTSGGLNIKVKNTTDFHLKNNPTEKWSKIDNELYKALNSCLEKYRNKYNAFFQFNNIEDTGFQIQRYIANEGFYDYHHDFLVENNKHRILTFLFYLNNVQEGGETEFFYGNFKINPIAGKCVLFPASWTFPHKGLMPISNDKYIVTGWLYYPN